MLVLAVAMGLLGSGPLWTAPAGSAQSQNAQTTISSVSPSQGTQGQTLDITITGTYFTGATAVTISGVTVNTFTVDSATRITANISVKVAATPGSRYIKVTTPVGRGALANGFTVVQGTPTITLISLSRGNQGQSLTVNIWGTSFYGITEVSFGPQITVDSYTLTGNYKITANITIDGGAETGARDVSVTTAGGTGTLVNGFTVGHTPTISTVFPNGGVQGQTLKVTSSGTYFTGATAVTINAVSVNSFTVDSATQITASICIDAAASPGTSDVSITTPGGTATLANGFTVVRAPPNISSVSPSQGNQGQTLNISIAGTYFTGATAATISGITVNSFTVNSATQITASISIDAATSPGARDVSVTTPGGVATLANGFTVVVQGPPPTISTIVPNGGAQGQILDVTITGTHFNGATAVSISGVTVNSFTVNSATQIAANISIDAAASPGARDVSVTAPGGTAALANGFTVVVQGPPPTISTVVPNGGVQGQTLDVTITGTHFNGATAVSVSGVTVNSFTVNSATQIAANISIDAAASPGARDVYITTPGGATTLANGFMVVQPPPTIGSVSPSQGAQGQTLDVTITGTNFTGATAATIGEVTVNTFTVTSDTQITASISIDPAASPGVRAISITTPRGTATLANGFTVVQALPVLIVGAQDSADPVNADFVCDGVDDEVEIQKAIDALSTQYGGGTVQLLPGNYNLGYVRDWCLQVPGNISIVGPREAVFAVGTYSGSNAYGVITSKTGDSFCKNVQLVGFTLDVGSPTGHTTTNVNLPAAFGPTYQELLVVSGKFDGLLIQDICFIQHNPDEVVARNNIWDSCHVRMLNSSFEGVGNAIFSGDANRIPSGEGFVAENNVFTNTCKYMALAGNMKGWVTRYNKFYDIRYTAIDCATSPGAVIEYNEVYGCVVGGIYSQGGAGVRIAHNYIERSAPSDPSTRGAYGGYGIGLVDWMNFGNATGDVIENNTVVNSNIGIYVKGVQATIQNNTLTGLEGDGIYLGFVGAGSPNFVTPLFTSDGSRVLNNTIKDFGRYATYRSAIALNCLCNVEVASNHIDGYGNSSTSYGVREAHSDSANLVPAERPDYNTMSSNTIVGVHTPVKVLGLHTVVI